MFKAELRPQFGKRCSQANAIIVQPAATYHIGYLHHSQLAGVDGGRMSHHDHQIALPARFDAQDAEAVVSVVVGDALHQPGQRLGRRRCAAAACLCQGSRVLNCWSQVGAVSPGQS